jgi:transglutaminase-like putative cysteine protease
MYYSIRHLTKFRYSEYVSESLMEARMQPRSDGPQRCLTFQLMVHPRARVQFYRDYLGNTVHHFDVPGGTSSSPSSPTRWWTCSPCRRCPSRWAKAPGMSWTR